MKTKSKRLFANLPADDAGLGRLLPPRRIHDQTDHANWNLRPQSFAVIPLESTLAVAMYPRPPSGR